MPTPQFTPIRDAHRLGIARRRGILGPDETYRASVRRVVQSLSVVDSRLESVSPLPFARGLERALLDGRLGLSSQLHAAAGRTGAVGACTVLAAPLGTDAAAVRELVGRAAAASAEGLGCGIDVSGFGDPAATTRALNGALHLVHERLVSEGRRPPAFMVTCDASHPRIREFIDTKADADFGAWVINISVRFGGDASTYRELRGSLACAAHRNGEPGILFGAPADRDNPTPECRLESTAPCAEVFMAAGERCVFVSVNVAAHVRDGRFDVTAFRGSVRLAVRAADNAVELAAVGAAAIVAQRRRVGVGVCGFHTALLGLRVPYAASARFAASLGEQLVYAAHDESAGLAERRGPFPLWESSRWRDVDWLQRKAALRPGSVSVGAWKGQERRILNHGVRNAVVVAYPPTGVVADLLGVSKSYEPHFDLRAGDGSIRPDVQLTLGPDDVLGDDGQVVGAPPEHLLAAARQLPPAVHLDVHAAFTGLADEAGSKTVNLPRCATVGDVAKLMDEARARGLKGLTVFRDGCLDPEGEAIR